MNRYNLRKKTNNTYWQGVSAGKCSAMETRWRMGLELYYLPFMVQIDLSTGGISLCKDLAIPPHFENGPAIRIAGRHRFVVRHHY